MAGLLVSNDSYTPDRLTQFIFAVFGVVIWEYANTMRVERIVRTTFHWADAVYLLCRYSTLLFVLGLVLCISIPSEARMNRSVVLTTISCAEAFIIAAGTTILVLRVAAVWKAKRKGTLCPLLAIVLLHWVLLCITLPYRKLWSGTSMDGFSDVYCSKPIIKAAAVFTTAFHALLLIAVISGQLSWGHLLRRVMMNDGTYFFLVLSAGAADTTLTFICAKREVHQGLRIAASACIGMATCRFFRRFDDHHRPQMHEETRPIVNVTRRLTQKPSQAFASLRHASLSTGTRSVRSGSQSLGPSTKENRYSVQKLDTSHESCDQGDETLVDAKIQPLPAAMCPRSPYIEWPV